MKCMLFSTFLLPLFSLAATTYYVDASNGADSNSGKSLSSAKKTIQAAIDAAASGDVVSVAEGAYKENLNLAKCISLIAASPLKVTIDGNQSGHCICITTGAEGCVLDGFVLYNGAPTNSGNKYGGGIECTVDATIQNCHLKDNGNDNQHFAGGIHTTDGASVLLYNCLLTGNKVFASGGASLTEAGSDLTFDRCTVYANNCSGYNMVGGISVANTGVVVVKNSIIWGNNGSQVEAFSLGGSGWTKTVSYSCVSGGYSGTGNVSSDPKFTNAANGDFSLQSSSPCINAGNPSNTDPDGTRSDMGFSTARISPVSASASNVDGLVAWYKFDGNANDSSGNGNNGTIHGVTLTTDRNGKPDSAYSFDGDDWISVAHSASLSSSALTISVWLNPSDWYGVNREWLPIVCKADYTYTEGSYRFQIQNCGTVIQYGLFGTVTATGGIELGKWQQVVATLDENRLSIYLNGKLVGVDENPGSIGMLSDTLEIGRDKVGGMEYFCGLMDDLRIYNRALSAAEVKSLYEEGAGTLSDGDLIHRWSLNGNLADSVGGQTAGTVGNVTTDGSQYTLAGGSRGSSYIDLGSNILPKDGRGVTLEIWGTQRSVKNWSRIWDIGGGTSTDMQMAWTAESNINSDGICIRGTGEDLTSKLAPYTLDVEFHVATVFKPQDNGTWKVYYYKQDASTGATLTSAVIDSTGSSWSLTTQNQNDCWLGHSHWSGDYDANASYNEVRVWGRALTEAELSENVQLGPDVLPGGSPNPGARTYTITFDANGGDSTPSALTKNGGEVCGTLPTITRDGYVFDGWYTAAIGGMRVAAEDVVTDDITLYAHWSKLEGAFVCTQYDMKSTVSSLTTAKNYIANSSKWKSDPVIRVYSTVAFSDDDSSVRDFETVAFPGNKTREDGKDNFVMVATGKVIIPESGDWSFACGTDDGFELTLTGGGKSYVMSYESTRGYENSVQSFTMSAGVYDLKLIYFDSTGGADCLLSATKSRCSAFNGHAFKLIGDPKCDIVTTVSSSDSRCTVAFNATGGSPAPVTITRRVGEPYGMMPVVKRDWFVFDGWYTAEDGGEPVDATTLVTEDILLHAHWKSAMARLTISDVTVLSNAPWKDVLIGYKVVGTVDDAVELRVSARDNATGKTYTCKTIDGADLTEGSHILKWRAQEDGAMFKSDDVVFTLNAVALPSKYRVVDLSGGTSATSYPVTDLDEVPSGGWSDDYKTTKLVLRRIEPGSFIMGEDQTVEAHRVMLTKLFYMGVFEVTQKQWELVMGSNPSSFTGNTHPVECVSYDMIRGHDAGSGWPQTAKVDEDSFIGALRAKTGLFVDLPTEAQWEYACRAGSTTTCFWGNELDEDYVWCANNSESATHVVGIKRPNGWGLYDMSGNVSEWNLDWWESGRLSYGVDPKGVDWYVYRVFRGGNWKGDSRYGWYDCGSSWRDSDYPGDAHNIIGFRIVAAPQELISQTVAMSKSSSVNTMIANDGQWVDGALDICSGARRTSEAQQLTMSPEWERNGAKSIVSVDGEPYQEATSAAECAWTGTRTKEYTLMHQVVDANGVAIGEPYVVQIIWLVGDLPAIRGDENAVVTGDAEHGFVITPNVNSVKNVEVIVPQGMDAGDVLVKVPAGATTVKPNGAKMKVVNGGADITEFLNVPAAGEDGVIDLSKVTVKEEIVKETMDVEKGAEIELNAANPKLTTVPTRTGLFYQLREGETLGGMKDGDSTIGDGKPWSPEITVKGGNSAFYSIGVGKGE